MPVYSQKDLIPFVNDLEAKLNLMNSDVTEWRKRKGELYTGLSDIATNKYRSLNAMVKADEALAELSTATFEIVATKGKKLKTLLDSLKDQMYEIAKEGGGGGTGFDPRINAEIDNAVSSVDAVIEDGLKLDYRLRTIYDTAAAGKSLSEKELFMPYFIEVEHMESNIADVPVDEGIEFVNGDVTVLDINGDVILDNNAQIVTGTINTRGHIVLSYPPFKTAKLFFPVRMAMKDIPEDFLYLFVNTLIQKNSKAMQDIVTFQRTLQGVITDITAMKGKNWTADFSIMKNHMDIVKETITPKGLQVEIKEGMAHATFSYNDHPYLSHFILEKLDEESGEWVAHDGDAGIIPK